VPSVAHADGSPKPAYTALKNLISMLKDPGPAFPLNNLQFTLTGDTANVDHLVRGVSACGQTACDAGTTPGTYTVTVTGTSASTTGMGTLTVYVQ